MEQNRQVRVVKRDQQGRAGNPAQALGGTVGAPTEREVKAVITGWVREHRERSEEQRHMLAAVFGGVRLQPTV
ncbi:MAG: hypothetical protein QOF61_3402 [Acidobacteriota bacterium]|nr:hypothetical protein [Acidobacteriota bacterium]